MGLTPDLLRPCSAQPLCVVLGLVSLLPPYSHFTPGGSVLSAFALRLLCPYSAFTQRLLSLCSEVTLRLLSRPPPRRHPCSLLLQALLQLYSPWDCLALLPACSGLTHSLLRSAVALQHSLLTQRLLQPCPLWVWAPPSLLLHLYSALTQPL